MVELSASDRDTVCTRMLRERLLPLGLAEIAPRRWIDGSKPPARRLFELEDYLRGGSLAEREAEKLRRLVNECKPA